MKKFPVKKLVLLAVFAALSYVIVCTVRIPAVAFLKYEPKDVVITIAGFILGPLASVIISAVVALLEMVTISETGPIGALMNLLSSCAFSCTAAFIYKYRRTLWGAVGGLLCGTVAMAAVMLLWNWLITPLYMGVPREAVEAMLLPTFLPFNLIKAGLNSALTLCLYKPLVTALRKTRLLDTPAPAEKSSRFGIYLLGGVLLITCILLLLVLQGKI